jgi:hypothetical protein
MITIVTESPRHERLLNLLLSDLVQDHAVEIIGDRSRDSARPLARQISLLRRRPVALVIDADTVDAKRVAQQQADLEWYFRLSSNGLPLQVVHFVPTVEIIFFERPCVLERLLGRKLEQAVQVAGEIAPRAVLDRMLPELAGENLLRRIEDLTGDDLRELRSHPTVATIRRFVEENAEPVMLRRSA